MVIRLARLYSLPLHLTAFEDDVRENGSGGVKGRRLPSRVLVCATHARARAHTNSLSIYTHALLFTKEIISAELEETQHLRHVTGSSSNCYILFRTTFCSSPSSSSENYNPPPLSPLGQHFVRLPLFPLKIITPLPSPHAPFYPPPPPPHHTHFCFCFGDDCDVRITHIYRQNCPKFNGLS